MGNISPKPCEEGEMQGTIGTSRFLVLCLKDC
jgi:hypothetical protein